MTVGPPRVYSPRQLGHNTGVLPPLNLEKSMNRITRLAVAVGLLIVLSPLSGCLVRSDTLPALIAAADAIKRHDPAGFAEYVDVEALVGQIVDLSMSEVAQKTPGFLERLLGKVKDLTRPTVVSLSKQLIDQLIRTGMITSLAGDMADLPTNKGIQGLVWIMGIPGERDSYKITEVTKFEGGGESLRLDVNVGKDQPPISFHVMSVTYNGHARITKIVNLGDVYGRFAQLAMR
jgi:hypothetical protein